MRDPSQDTTCDARGGGAGELGPVPQVRGYDLLQRLGQGGVGEVWLAEQTHPVRRRVALKLIRPGMDSREVLARFEAERQALAVLDHPAVAKVFDAGTTIDGRPYFVMEYVPGEPITTYCDRHELPIAERLQLFVRVCEGVQHAHHKGIIHCDRGAGERRGPARPLRATMRPHAVFVGLATIAAVVAVSGGAGATTTRTYPAGAPPWYRGDAPRPAKFVVVPVAIAPGPGLPEAWAPLDEMRALAGAMSERLAGRTGSALVEAPEDGRPAVYLGCALDDPPEFGECAPGDAREMVLAISGPSRKWKAWLAETLARHEADHALVITLTVAEHWLRQKDWKGNKQVPLGTEHAQPAPWLTSLQTPVPVLQLTGLLVNRDGKVVRAGVEGLLAIRTRFSESVLGVQRLLTADDVESVRTGLRRDDLPGQPLAWEAALDTLVRQLGLAGPRR